MVKNCNSLVASNNDDLLLTLFGVTIRNAYGTMLYEKRAVPTKLIADLSTAA